MHADIYCNNGEPVIIENGVCKICGAIINTKPIDKEEDVK